MPGQPQASSLLPCHVGSRFLRDRAHFQSNPHKKTAPAPDATHCSPHTPFGAPDQDGAAPAPPALPHSAFCSQTKSRPQTKPSPSAQGERAPREAKPGPVGCDPGGDGDPTALCPQRGCSQQQNGLRAKASSGLGRGAGWKRSLRRDICLAGPRGEGARPTPRFIMLPSWEETFSFAVW